MKPTVQQENIINAAVERKNIAIQARAGAAKTTTCVMIANEVVKPSLYMAFNKDIAEEAKGKFPPHVTCQTVHSLAYRAIVKFPKSAFGKRLGSVLQLSDIDAFMGDIVFSKEEDAFDFKLTVRELIVSFCQSDARDLNVFIFWALEGIVENLETVGQFQKVCSEYWMALTKETSSVGISHDIYLKMYQLSDPVLIFDVIYLDEGQDSNPVTLDIFLHQSHAQRIIVGDSFQAIYAWRGAVDAFSKVPKDFVKMELTESFRYTQEIAETAKKVLSVFKDVEITGKGLIENYKESNNNNAVICRNNSTILEYLITAAKQGDIVATNVNLKEIFSKVYHVSALMFGSEPKFPVKELLVYKTFKELKQASEKLPEIKQLINLTQTLSSGDTLFNNITKIKNIITSEPYEAAYFITTAHKSKGLEFDRVSLDADMLQCGDEEESFEEWAVDNPQEINLLYVAVTRAKYKLELPENISKVLKAY